MGSRRTEAYVGVLWPSHPLRSGPSFMTQQMFVHGAGKRASSFGPLQVHLASPDSPGCAPNVYERVPQRRRGIENKKKKEAGHLLGREAAGGGRWRARPRVEGAAPPAPGPDLKAARPRSPRPRPTTAPQAGHADVPPALGQAAATASVRTGAHFVSACR
jgi:hypothetical protein